jgi:hypothetical protein
VSGIFDVTAAADHVPLNADGKGEASFTVTSSSARSIRAQFRLRPLEETKSEWLSLVGEAEVLPWSERFLTSRRHRLVDR